MLNSSNGMNKAVTFILLSIFLCQCKGKDNVRSVQYDEISDSTEIESDAFPRGVKIIMQVYSSHVVGYKDGFLLMADGDSILYDDGREKGFEEMLDDSDVEDMFNMPYDRQASVPAYLADAGRSRCEQLFKNMYGRSAKEVQKRMEVVDWFGQKIRFSTTNGCADSLRAVAREIAAHVELLPYMRQSSSFYWRTVRGAKRQSAHSYGIAIDICTDYSNYWLWSNPRAKETDRIGYEKRIPMYIVEIFERHGFIWGGRWSHYDTLHFEFRHEILLYS